MEPKKIVFLYGAQYDLGWGRSQNLCKGFIEMGHQVTYIEHPISIRFLFSNKKNQPKEMRGKLNIIKLYGLPVRRFPILTRLNTALIKYQIRKAIAKDFLMADILWIYDVAHIDLVNLFSAKKRVYDCADDRVSRFAEQFGEKQAGDFRQKENLIIENADHIFAVTDELLKNIQARIRQIRNPRFSVLSNGVDFDYFNNFRNSHGPKPKYLEGLNTPMIGYIGTITYWIDLDLIISVAQVNPDYSFVLIGPLQIDIGCISSCKNIHYLGPVPYKEVPKYIKTMDVCMLPFKSIESVVNADSLKVAQYFALGKPVVSTIKPAVMEYEDLIWTGQDRRTFSVAIEFALKEGQELSRRRIMIAKNRSWQSICEKALSRIYESD